MISHRVREQRPPAIERLACDPVEIRIFDASRNEMTKAGDEVIGRLSIRLRDLLLPSRVRACAEKLGMERVGDLVQVPTDTLLAQQNFGHRSLRVLKRILSRLGLGLGLRVEGWPPANLSVLSRQSSDSARNALRRMLIPQGGGTLEDELRQLTAPAGSPRNMSIAAQCLGWDGGGGVTLAVVGRLRRISRQRASQIVKRVRRQYQHASILPPRLERCLRAATPRLAEGAGVIEDRLHRAGETRRRFRLEGLLTAVEVLHLPAPFEIIHIAGNRVVVRPEKRTFVLTALACAMRTVSRAGAVSISDFARMLRNDCSVMDLEDLLPLHPRFEWLDDSKTWFWFRPIFSPTPGRMRNRLVNEISKFVSAAGPIHPGELLSLIQRMQPNRGSPPPGSVLLEVCRRIPGYSVREGTIIRIE